MAGIDDELGYAFGLLLGKPLAEFDPEAVYAVFHYDDETADELPDVIEPGEPGRSGDTGGEALGLERWVPDLAGSAFVLGADGRIVWGRDLGVREPVVENYRRYPIMLLRPRTDGSLFDAMRAATWTMSAPDGLSDVEDGLRRGGYLEDGGPAGDPRWEPVLAQVTNEALRRHLRGLCLDQRWSRFTGAWFAGPGECPSDLRPVADLPKTTVIAGWEFGEGQAATAVVAFEPGTY